MVGFLRLGHIYTSQLIASTVTLSDKLAHTWSEKDLFSSNSINSIGLL